MGLKKNTPVNQVWLLNQVLLNQEKLTLKKSKKFWDLSILVAKQKCCKIRRRYSSSPLYVSGSGWELYGDMFYLNKYLFKNVTFQSKSINH